MTIISKTQVINLYNAIVPSVSEVIIRGAQYNTREEEKLSNTKLSDLGNQCDESHVYGHELKPKA